MPGWRHRPRRRGSFPSACELLPVVGQSAASERRTRKLPRFGARTPFTKTRSMNGNEPGQSQSPRFALIEAKVQIQTARTALYNQVVGVELDWSRSAPTEGTFTARARP